jgi:hypothetical protein
MQIVIFFIFITIRTQKHFVNHMISQSSLIFIFFIEVSNIVFDLEDFLSKLETIIFERDEIKKDVLINQVRFNSQLKRIILTSFNENDVIIRRIIVYNNEEQRINVKKRTYCVYREISLKTKNTIYR